MTKRAAFIVLEGGEGAGKTSVLAALTDALRTATYNVLATREPGGTAEGLRLREVLLSEHAADWDPCAELLLMTAARIQHVKRVISPALAEGSIVLCDRFVGSTLAYQGAGRGIDQALIEELHDRMVGLRPDLTILLDVEPHLGLARSMHRLQASRADEGRFEAMQLDFHERVRMDFLRQAKVAPETHAVIDGSLAASDVQGRALEFVLDSI